MVKVSLCYLMIFKSYRGHVSVLLLYSSEILIVTTFPCSGFTLFVGEQSFNKKLIKFVKLSENSMNPVTIPITGVLHRQTCSS